MANVKVEQLMSGDVQFVRPEDTVETARRLLLEEHLGALPVVDRDGELQGIVTRTDLLRRTDGDEPLTRIMSEHVFVVPPYADVHVAARIMLNHGLHHVVVTLEKKVVGLLSSYDLLHLVADHRFVAKGAPTPSKRKGRRRRKRERELAAERTEAAAELAAEIATAAEAEAAELNRRERLEQLLGHLSRRTAKVERDLQRADEPLEQDFNEAALTKENDDVLEALSSEGRDQLALVGRALERLDEGSYGTCEDCGAAIGEARLEALPYATTCIHCARQRELAAANA